MVATGVALVVLSGCTASAAPAPVQPSADQQAKNIIVLFADGVGPSQLEIGRYASQYLRSQPSSLTDTIMTQGSVGLVQSHAAETIATDSAAAGTAMSCGQKTTIGTIGMDSRGQACLTIMEAARAAKKRIGLVTTATVYDATPAAFSVHAKSRRDYQAIVDQYLTLEPDVILGGGRDFFVPKGVPGGKRSDNQDVLAAFRAKGYQVVSTAKELEAAKGPRVLGLFDDEDMDHEIDRDREVQPSVAEMAQAAIRILSQGSPNGFVLLVETENTDTASHRNDIAALLRDLWAFDDAARHALAYQKQTATETVVILAGDHETGGLSVTYAQKDGTLASSSRFYASAEHLGLISRITISQLKAAQTLGEKPSAEAVDKVVTTHYPGFRLDPDLRAAIVEQKMLEWNSTYPTENALGRMVARQTGVYWGTSGHSAQPVAVAALGPGAGRFSGYLDNTDFGRVMHELITGKQAP